MKLEYKYVSVRCYKKSKGYTDESHIIGSMDAPFKTDMTEEENIEFYEKNYWDVYKPPSTCDVVGSISKVYSVEDISDDKERDAEIEAELFKSTQR